ncbi:MAG: hypothetical protein MHPSP_004265, partial [Paramarteilia canceri]
MFKQLFSPFLRLTSQHTQKHHLSPDNSQGKLNEIKSRERNYSIYFDLLDLLCFVGWSLMQRPFEKELYRVFRQIQSNIESIRDLDCNTN